MKREDKIALREVRKPALRCPKCGSDDIALPDNEREVGGAACETCGHRGRRKDFRVIRDLKEPLTAEEKADMDAFLDRFKVR